jgi:outer membrane protein assembly factor BamA
MNVVRRIALLLFVSVTVAPTAIGQQVVDSIANKSSRNVIKRIVDYFDSTNKPTEAKKFDFSVIGGPHYSTSTNFGIGLVAAGLYRSDPTDSVAKPNYVGVYADFTVKLYFQFGVEGYHIFDSERWRLEYDVSMLRNPTKFWGIGYVNGKNSNNETDYKKWQVAARVALQRNFAERFFAGVLLRANYARACNIEGSYDLWAGQRRHAFNLGVGLTATYDTRDNMSNAYTGVYLNLRQMFYPKFIGNSYAFSSTEATLRWYKPVWTDALIACQLHGMLTYGNTHWGMMPMLGNNETMRGYYEGRYIDKSMVDATVELRQHIYRRHSAVGWVGVGEVFSNTSHLTLDKLLPNYGVGYRWEFKQRVNVRLDVGFGRRQTGVIFSVNEAF